MLKGHVFKKQLFGNQIFALFVDTFLNKNCGIAGNYGNKMKVTYSGSMLTVSSGCACIRGRFLEEDTNTQIDAGTDTAFCKLVIEVNLNLENTDASFVQGSYKIVKSASGYPTLTQTDIVKNNSGIYQFELAQFKTGTNGITNFVDKRTYLDLDSIYQSITLEYREVLEELREELANVEDGSAYLLKTRVITTANEDLDDYVEDGVYYFSPSYTPVNIPTGVINGWLQVMKSTTNGAVKQIWYRGGTANTNDFETYVRTKTSGTWSNWQRYMVENDLYYKDGDSLTLTWAGSGHLTSSATEFVFSIPLPKRVKNIVNANITAGQLFVRRPTGGYIVNGDSILTDNNIIINAYENILTVRLVHSTAYSETNNIPVGIQINGLKIEFIEPFIPVPIGDVSVLQ